LDVPIRRGGLQLTDDAEALHEVHREMIELLGRSAAEIVARSDELNV
jgi:DNA-binding transcriptional LysR family regulator